MFKGKGIGKGRYALVTHNNETHTLKEWGEIKGVRWDTLYHRLFTQRWSVDEALNKKPRVYLKDAEERKQYRLKQKELHKQELLLKKEQRKQELLLKKEQRKQELLLKKELKKQELLLKKQEQQEKPKPSQASKIPWKKEYTEMNKVNKRTAPYTPEDLKNFDEILDRLMANAPMNRKIQQAQSILA